MKFVKALYKDAMTPEVLSWDDASNNRYPGVGPRLVDPQSDLGLPHDPEVQSRSWPTRSSSRKTPAGPVRRLAAGAPNSYVIWNFSKNKDTAFEFLRDYMRQLRGRLHGEHGYNHPLFQNIVPKPQPIFSNDPIVASARQAEGAGDRRRMVRGVRLSRTVRAGAGRGRGQLHHPRHDGQGRDRQADAGRSGDWAQKEIELIYKKWPADHGIGEARPAFRRRLRRPLSAEIGLRLVVPAKSIREEVIRWPPSPHVISASSSARSFAVNDISLSVSDGEFLVLLGPSGCGKTTFLRMIAGLERPTSGDILIDGEIVNELPPRARGIAMVFQSYALYPHLTVANNIAFPLEPQARRETRSSTRSTGRPRTVRIDHLLDRKPRQLSGGERQRVALARALVREPTVFLLDEPLSQPRRQAAHLRAQTS